MAEENEVSRSPESVVSRVPTSVGDENPREETKKELAKDRKSLTGMSEKVKATLAPLLGGIKHHPEVEVDLGRESGTATYETVPMGSTPMSRYSADAVDPSLVEKVKEKGTSDPNPNPNPDPDRLPTAVRDRLPVQDVGLGHSNVYSGSKPGHKPNEDKYVLDGNTDPAERFRSTTPTSEAFNQGPREATDDWEKGDNVRA